MLARLSAAAIIGVDAVPVSVEVDVSAGGLPGVTMVGLPDTTVRESRDRVRTAIRNSGFPFPMGRVTVSLAPADLKKVGAAFDLPIALGILAAGGVLPHREEQRFTIVGGLSLDGAVPPMRGLLPIAVSARVAAAGLVFPAANAPEAAIVDGVALFPVRTLMDAARVISSPTPTPATPPAGRAVDPDVIATEDLIDVRGQLLGRRAIEIAAAGGHHLLFSGPPGAGKTMLARRLPGLLPPGVGLIRARPFRAPHHTCSDVALVGGGAHPRPGELSLAHDGVLFLDELPEFSRRVLETLRQPLEQGTVLVSRAARSVSFPAQVMLVGAMNPCPCGYHGSDQRICRCPPPAVERYWRRLSGPLQDRFDLGVELPAVPWRDLQARATGESSAEVRPRVLAARERQLARQQCLNGRLDGRALQRHGRPADSSTEVLLGRAVTRLRLSVRGVSRVLRVARTISDLEGSPGVERRHVAEALQFRLPDPAVSAVNA
jgi:magnesium chelatase family protein